VEKPKLNLSDDEAAAWVIPLHGIPLPPNSETAEPLAANTSASADQAPDTLPFAFDEIPTDEGYHPRLRRSA
jgi:hypothetical protein